MKKKKSLLQSCKIVSAVSVLMAGLMGMITPGLAAAGTEEDIRQLKTQVKALEEKVALTEKKTESVMNFEFQGYARAGYGVNSEGGKFDTLFWAPGAGGHYRLGNESDYGELILINHLQNPDKKGPTFDTRLNFSFLDRGYSTWDPNYEQDDFLMRESYAYAGNFSFNPSATFWAGKRFYRMPDIHIIDMKPLAMDGFGGGVEKIDVGVGQLSIAFFGASSAEYDFDNQGHISKNTLDLRFAVKQLGTATFWAAPSWMKGGEYTMDDTEYKFDNSNGWALGFFHESESEAVFGGSNYFTIQYGRGTGYSFNAEVTEPNNDLNDASSFLITNCLTIQPIDLLSTQLVAAYRVTDNGADKDSTITWTTFGLRPVIHLNKYFSVAFEGGLDYVKNETIRDENGDPEDGVLRKVTIAPMVSAPGFWGRPSIRLYATYAKWGNEFKGDIGGKAYADGTDGSVLGVQYESWW